MQKYDAGAQYILQNIPGFKEKSYKIKQLTNKESYDRHQSFIM
jgi:hypothetical protein